MKTQVVEILMDVQRLEQERDYLLRELARVIQEKMDLRAENDRYVAYFRGQM